ncbi:hypothetical protein [uncultured Flavobacterium sp.]|uniref:hypothetical protein n=1 Tax=uncultured Flavobacterium sp. TaxID=165435 RepID=UPI0030EC4619
MKSIQLVLLFSNLLLTSFLGLFAQEKEDYLITYDSIIGKENLAVTNGLFHYNNYRINDNKDIYYSSEKYIAGSLNYLGQIYYDLFLKYDAYNDELVYRSSGNSEKTGINLIKSNVNSFKINELNFVNLDKIESENKDFIKGFYEEKIKNNTLSLYIKHSKSKREIFIGKNILVEFSDESEFIVYKDKKFNRITSKKSVINEFPDKKKMINEYYKNNSELKKKNKTLFFTSLFKNISQ